MARQRHGPRCQCLRLFRATKANFRFSARSQVGIAVMKEEEDEASLGWGGGGP